jgi:hypothetical protein|tara:strand:+ start:860 stop:1465 length:606 start_codon:yes stop_codon:yes gene_type:complete
MALVKYNNRSILNVTALGSVPAGGLNLITTNTISSGVSSSSFTSNIDSTYDTYLFKFINIHGASATDFQINFSVDGGSNYNVTKTTTAISAYHGENDSTPDVYYITSHDLAQSTSAKKIMGTIYNDDDNSGSGYLYLFNPSSTTFVKHFISSTQRTDNATSNNFYTAGYGNTTSAINAVQFTMASGNIDSGVIKMYGLSKS